ncbi:MAG: NAD(P)H-binding protein [Chromatiales bacterium]|nr:MAG: NAD(P)H-binding protein [Chromatiales bacterium]
MSRSPVLIFCADTDTGYRLAQLSRREDRRVIAVVRERADPILLVKLKCDIVVGDPTDRDDVHRICREYASERPAVVCLLGGTPQLNSQGNINVIDAAVEHKLHRFILLTSVGCGDSASAVDPFVKAFVGKALQAKNWAERHLRATALDWTIIRPGGLVRRASRGTPMLVESSTVSGHINVYDLGDLVHQALRSDHTVRRIYAAVDDARAYDVQGKPVKPAEL